MSDVNERRVFGGRWAVERELSAGGMGVVYVARHTETGRPVALKVIKTGEAAASADLVARFKRETGALAAVSHPNVVTFLDCGVEQGTLFLVMELLSGRPLRSIMNEPVDPQRALRICADVCRALAALHQLGIVHRDLKPENIFLVDAVGHEEHAKLIDFGIVRLETAGDVAAKRTHATSVGMVVGTPGYISPEQLQGQPATAASDVYAVGVILYELLTGKFPFEAPTTTAMLVKQLVEPLPPPRTLRPSLPQHVEDLVLSFMDRDPALRMSTAQGALARILAAEKHVALSLEPAAPTEHALTAARLAPSSSSQPLPSQPSSSPQSRSMATPDTSMRVEPRSLRAPFPVAVVAGGAAAAVAVVAVIAIVALGGDGAGDDDDVIADAPPATAMPAEPAAPPSPATASPPEAPPAPATATATTTQPTFTGTWKGSFTGNAVVGGRSTPERGSSSVRIASPAPGKLTLAFTDKSGKAPCTNTLALAGDRATFSPPKQRCTLTVRGGERASESTGTLTLQKNGTLVFDVSGSFAFYASGSGDAVLGTFKHRWTLRR